MAVVGRWVAALMMAGMMTMMMRFSRSLVSRYPSVCSAPRTVIFAIVSALGGHVALEIAHRLRRSTIYIVGSGFPLFQ